jgi:DNA primase
VRGVIVEDIDTLLFLVEAGAASLQMTPWREAAPGTADFVALRIAGARARQVAQRTREIVKATGLEAFAKTAGTGFDVLVPIGEAPAAHVLTALFASLLARLAESLGATVETLDAPIVPYGIAVPVGSDAPATASVPVTWDALSSVEAPSSLDLVRERFAIGATDPMRAMLTTKVDFARAVLALEQMVAQVGHGG